MTIELFDTQTICTHYLSTLINGDNSALEGDEDILVDAYLARIPACASFDYDSEEGSEFARDEISGLMADCLTVRVMADSEHIAALEAKESSA